jgi:hypothetical protein
MWHGDCYVWWNTLAASTRFNEIIPKQWARPCEIHPQQHVKLHEIISRQSARPCDILAYKLSSPVKYTGSNCQTKWNNAMAWARSGEILAKRIADSSGIYNQQLPGQVKLFHRNCKTLWHINTGITESSEINLKELQGPVKYWQGNCWDQYNITVAIVRWSGIIPWQWARPCEIYLQ